MGLRIPDIDLHEKVDDLVAQVPEGMITTYGAVAKALGDIVASRFVGKVMSENDDIVRVPCRRVVQSDGHLGGFSAEGGVLTKKKALIKEGIEIEGDRIVDFERRLFTDFKTSYPLRTFRNIQRKDLRKLKLQDDFRENDAIAGADIAYKDDEAFGSLVTFGSKDLRKIEVVRVKARVRFPYIPTYLTFREAPVIEKLIEKAGQKPLLVYDGNGIIHPLGFGVASHIGVMLDLPTIGVAKKLLCGTVNGKGIMRRVIVGGRLAGYAATGKEWSAPVYISPGHRISSKSTLKILKPYWKYRLPEPVRLAHIEAEKSRRAAQ